MGADRRHFEALYAAHAPAVFAYALRRTDRATAEDVLADVFLVVWRRLHELPSDPRSFLLGTARKTLANHRRTVARQQAVGERLFHERPAANDGPHAADAGDDPEILRALAQLSESDREALLLVGWDGLAPREAAAVLGVAAPTFTMRLSRARKRLAAALEEVAAASPSDLSSPFAAPRTSERSDVDPCEPEASRA